MALMEVTPQQTFKMQCDNEKKNISNKMLTINLDNINIVKMYEPSLYTLTPLLR